MEDIYTQDEDGDTLLHLAVIHGHTKMAYEILGYTANEQKENCDQSRSRWNATNTLRQTPLHLASILGSDVLLPLMVSAGIDHLARDWKGNTALHLSCMYGHLECVRYLVSLSGAPVDLLNYQGQSCLHLAASQSNMDIVKALLACKQTNINITEGLRGKTILHQAVESRNMKLLGFLLPNAYHLGLDLDVQTYDMLTPIQLAESWGYIDIVDLLCLLLPQSRSHHNTAECSKSDTELDMNRDDDGIISMFNDFTIGGIPIP